MRSIGSSPARRGAGQRRSTRQATAAPSRRRRPRPSRMPPSARAPRSWRIAFPAFGGMRIAERWAGVIDATPDGVSVPVISDVRTLPGFYIASDFSGHGFGIGQGAGYLMADLVTGKTPFIDPTPIATADFPGGSNAPQRYQQHPWLKCRQFGPNRPCVIVCGAQSKPLCGCDCSFFGHQSYDLEI